MGKQSCSARSSAPRTNNTNVTANTRNGYSNSRCANDPYFEAAVNAARTRTHQLAVRHGLSQAEREDIQQELILDLLEHRKQFDLTKGSAGTFTGMVSRNRAVELLDGLIKQRMRAIKFEPNTDAANDPDESESPKDFLDALHFKRYPEHDLFTDGMALHDLQCAIAYMNGDQSALLDLVYEHPDLVSACAASGASNAAFYRRVHDLRMHLRMFGLRAVA